MVRKDTAGFVEATRIARPAAEAEVFPREIATSLVTEGLPPLEDVDVGGTVVDRGVDAAARAVAGFAVAAG